MIPISVIIPAYKPGNYIYECLDSLANQTFNKDDFETIIILNGCKDPWFNNLHEWIAKHPKLIINLIQTDAPGVSNARNIALNIAKGEYIAFIDDDDYVSPQYLEELYKCADKKTVALSDAISFNDETGFQNENYGQHRLFQKLKDKNYLSLVETRKFFNGPVMKLIHRNIIGNRKFNKQFTNGEDSLFMFLISEKIKIVKFTTSKAVYYRRIRHNSATTRKRKRINIILNCLKMCIYYTKYYFSNPNKYNLPFLFSRYAASVKTMIYG